MTISLGNEKEINFTNQCKISCRKLTTNAYVSKGSSLGDSTG